MSKGDPIQLATAIHIYKKWKEKWEALGKYAGKDADIEYHVCGSIRREEKMIRDIDILVIDADHHGAFEKGTKFEGVELNLCFVRKECEGAGLLFLTGDHKFNIGLRAKAKGMGLKLNRYGLFRGDEAIAGETEEGIFEALGMAYVAPQQRKSPNGQKGIMVPSSQIGSTYEVFVSTIHGFNFCNCRSYQFRRDCRHIQEAAATV